jgi:hypothetical protein
MNEFIFDADYLDVSGFVRPYVHSFCPQNLVALAHIGA